MEKQYDIKRLAKIITDLEKCFVLLPHMDEKEYRRMRDYISSRFDVSFPYNNPTTISVTPPTGDNR